MVGDITIYALISGGAFATVVLTAVAANIFMRGKKPEPGVKYGKAVTRLKMWFFGLFVAIGFGLVPIAVSFLTENLLSMIPDSGIPVFLHENGMFIVYGFWVLYIAGLAIALPVMMKAGFFEED